MMTWVWKDQSDDEDRFYADYDYDFSTLSGHLLRGPKPIAKDAGVAVLNAKRYSPARIRKYGCLPAASHERVIHQRLAPALLASVGESEIQLFPMTVLAKGGERLDEFLAVVPLNAIPCTDVEQSEITGWIAPEFPGATAHKYNSLKHIDGCLGVLNIARDSITNLVVVSDKLKNSLEATHEPGLCFVRPEDMRSYIV